MSCAIGGGKRFWSDPLVVAVPDRHPLLDDQIAYYNNERTHQGKMCNGRTPMQNLIEREEEWEHKVAELDNHI